MLMEKNSNNVISEYRSFFSTHLDQLYNLDRKTIEGLLPEQKLAFLQRLQEYHVEKIPFTGINAFVNRSPSSLNLDNLIERILIKRTGGYCFEVNRLFHHLLHELGLNPIIKLGRVFKNDFQGIPPKTHLVNIVNINSKAYLLDVAFGASCIIHPLEISLGKVAKQYDNEYRLVEGEKLGLLFQQMRKSQFVTLYSFNRDIEVFDSDIWMGHQDRSTSFDSYFVKNFCLSKVTKDKRILIENFTLKIFEGEKITEMNIQSQFFQSIESEFAMTYDETTKEKIFTTIENTLS